MIRPCRICGSINPNQESELKDMENQLEKEFGENYITEDCDIVCDPCFQKMFPNGAPNQ